MKFWKQKTDKKKRPNKRLSNVLQPLLKIKTNKRSPGSFYISIYMTLYIILNPNGCSEFYMILRHIFTFLTVIKIKMYVWYWGLVNPEGGRMKLENCELQANLGHLMRHCLKYRTEQNKRAWTKQTSIKFQLKGVLTQRKATEGKLTHYSLNSSQEGTAPEDDWHKVETSSATLLIITWAFS